jgi:hypothetical protein
MNKELQNQIDKFENCDECGKKGRVIPPSKIVKENGRTFQIIKFICPNNHEYVKYLELK